MERQDDLFSQGPVVVFQWRNAPGWPVEFVTPNVETLYGYTAGEFLEGRVAYADVVLEADRERVGREVRRYSEAGVERFQHQDYRIQRKDGGRRWVQDYTLIRRDAQGTVTGYLGYVVDVTARKEAEEGLRDLSYRLEQRVAERTARLQALVEHAFNAVVAIDEESRVTVWNERAEELFGWHREEAVGADLAELIIPPGQREGHREGIRRYLATGEGPLLNRRLELTGRRKGGGEVPIDLVVSAVPAGGGHDFIAIIRDVSERRQYQEALERDYHIRHAISEILEIALEPGTLQEDLQRILERVLAMPWLETEGRGAIFLADDEGARLEMAAAHNLAASVCAECVGVAYGECLCGQAAETQAVVFRGHLTGDHSRCTEGAADHGHYCVPVHSRDRLLGVLNIYLAAGHAWDEHEQEFLEAVAATLGGVIERKRAEQEQAALVAELKDAHGQLLQSEKMASVGQLAAGVAHEINNPIGYVNSNLGSLEGYLQDLFRLIDTCDRLTAEGGGVDEALGEVRRLKEEVDLEYLRQDLHDLVAESREGLDRVKRIIQDLKDFSRADQGEAWQWADLHAGLDSTLNIVWNELKYKAEVVKAYGELPEICCLPSQLNQVFMNLLVNAGHAIEERGTITLRTGTEGDGRGVWVEVADSGCGMPAEQVRRIFEPFFTTKPVGRGTGLGLSMAYNIVEKHGGRIEVESVEGTGTTFRVHLPVAPPDAPEEEGGE